MKNNRSNRNKVKRCLMRYMEESQCTLLSKHMYAEPIFYGDILVVCTFKTRGFYAITESITLSGRSLCERYGEEYDE